ELLPIGDAAEFAVGHHAEAAVFLQSHHIADRLVLCGAEFRVGQRLGRVLPECLAQLLRSQEAADMVGAAGRTSGSHGISFLLAYRIIGMPRADSATPAERPK